MFVLRGLILLTDLRLFRRDQLDALPANSKDLSFGNSVYKIRFEDRENRPMFGHRYWFYLQDAVDDVPEYVVHWDTFVQYVGLTSMCSVVELTGLCSVLQACLRIRALSRIQERVPPGLRGIPRTA